MTPLRAAVLGMALSSFCPGVFSSALADCDFNDLVLKRSTIPLGDGLVEVTWLIESFGYTGLSIGPFYDDPRPTILPAVPTAAEVEARTGEFIDAHDELFHVAAADLSPLGASYSLGTWRVSGQQTYRGIPVVGTFDMDVTSEGKLVRLDTWLYPTSRLVQSVNLNAAVTKEEAVSLANAISPLLGVVSPGWSEPTKSITFRSHRPILAWQVDLGDSRYGPPRPPPMGPFPDWRATVAADTGEVLALAFRPDCDNPENCPRSYNPFIRGDANRDCKLDIADPTFTLDLLFLGRATTWCRIASDSNGDSSVDVSDPIYTLSFLFLGGPPPPYPSPGIAIAPDFAGCLR